MTFAIFRALELILGKPRMDIIFKPSTHGREQWGLELILSLLYNIAFKIIVVPLFNYKLFIKTAIIWLAWDIFFNTV